MSSRSLLKTRARPVKTPSLMPPFHAGDLEDRAALGREVAAQEAEAARLLERPRDGMDDLVIRLRRIETSAPARRASRPCT